MGRFKNALDVLTGTQESVAPPEDKFSGVRTIGSVVEETTLEQRLERAADLILSQLTPSIREFAEEVADIVLHIPRWQLVTGSVLAQFESGTLQAPSLDPSWHDRGEVNGKRICGECGEEFTPYKPFQRWCSNKCGIIALHKKVEDVVVAATT